jgi:3-keto-L-gulonate-6-phosphate decarboxylase
MIVQAAIDIIEINKAIDVAGQALEAGVDWIEVGYPLIKFQGLNNTLALFRKTFPDAYILADCNIIAGSKRYIDKVAGEGLNNVTVSSLIPEYSTQEAIEYSKTYPDLDITVDLFNCANPVTKAKWAESLGADYVMVHFGLDQMKRESFEGALQSLKDVVSATALPISFATYSAEQGVLAAQAGAQVLVQGYPFLEDADPKAKFAQYVDAVKSI